VKKNLLLIFLFILALIASHRQLKNDQHSFSGQSSSEYEKEERKTDQPDKFLLYHRGIRTGAAESAPGYSSNYKWREVDKARDWAAMRRRTNGRTKSNGLVEWKERGPANVPGRTRALFNIPGDASNQTWLAGAATGGIWRTSNGGDTWTETTSDFPAMPISSFASDKNGSVIYAGTGEYVSSLYSAVGNGIFKSTDQGQTWTQLPFTDDHPDFSIVTRLVVDPEDKDIIVATTVPHNLTLRGDFWLSWRSTDGGAHWDKRRRDQWIF
jgi:photosystem II stability/assembly factor-like uncharacterized protein